MTKIAVIGAGITGVTTASSLMDRGYDVTLFDRNRYAAMHTSFANGGHGRRQRVFYSTGHGHLGWTLSAVTAEMVAEAAAGSDAVDKSGGATASSALKGAA